MSFRTTKLDILGVVAISLFVAYLLLPVLT